MTDEDGNPIGARVGQNTNQGNNRSEVSVYAWVIGFFVACFVGWYFFIKSDDEEKCGTGFILENGKCRAVKMADPVMVPPGSVPLITPTGIVAVPAGPVNMPVVNEPPVSKTCDTGFILENGKCVAVKMEEPITVPPGSVPLITSTGIVAVPAAPINVPVVNAGPNDENLGEYKWNYGDIDDEYGTMPLLTSRQDNERNCAAQCRYHKDRCKAAVYNPEDRLCYLHDSLQPEHGGKGYRNEPGRHGVRRVAIKPSAVPVWRHTENADASTGPVQGTWASGVRGIEDCKIACNTANCRSISFHKPDGACVLHQPHDKFRVNERVGEYPYDVYENPMYL